MSDHMRPRGYASRGPSKSAGVGGSCDTCQSGSGDDCVDYQRIPVYQDVPAVDPVPAEGVDHEIEINHRGDWFKAHKLFLEARLADGSVNHFAYVRAFEIDEDRQDCISSDAPRGIPIAAYSGQGGCCDGLRVCLDKFANDSERKTLKIHVRVFGGAAQTIHGYLTGRCEDCGYEKLCQPRQ